MSAYCSRADVETIYGVGNVTKWADADNTRVALDITARITWAIEEVSDRIDTRLAVRFTVPFTTIPTRIKNIAARMCGVVLYQFPRGISDGEVSQDFSSIEEKCADDFSRILNGIDMLIGVTPIGTSAPDVVEFEGKSVTDNA